MPKPTKSATVGRFTKAAQPVRHRLIGSSYGADGTGKTFLWLSAPGPIFIQSFDFGLEGVVEQFQGRKDVYVREYDWTPGKTGLTQADAVALRDQFIQDYELALNEARTLIWDKETEVWELFRYAEFGGPNEAPRNYPELNQRYRYYIRRPYERGLNFGLIQGVKEKWISERDPGSGKLKPHNTGELVRTGFGELQNLMQINLAHTREGGAFAYRVGKCRQNSALQDETFTFEAGDNPFVGLAMMVFPDTTEVDWQ